VEKYIEALRKESDSDASDEELLLNNLNREEYDLTYVEIGVSRENWETIINELNKPKKKTGIFTFMFGGSPVGIEKSIKILYDNGKETHVTLFLVEYYKINDQWYFYNNKGGPRFGVINEIIEKERTKAVSSE